MNQKELNAAANKYVNEYELFKAASHPYEIKGIFHSELLMFITIAEELKASKIIESGRARGQSTEIISRYAMLEKIEFESIESHEGGEDAEIAEARLRLLPVNLHYGDSFILMPQLINPEKRNLILIDGPKGANMWNLFQIMISIPGVIGVAMHDSHEGASVRNKLDLCYRDKYLISDNKEFVEKFKYLDDECWNVNPWGPYEMGSYLQGKVFNLRKCESYAGTLSFVEKI